MIDASYVLYTGTLQRQHLGLIVTTLLASAHDSPFESKRRSSEGKEKASAGSHPRSHHL